MAAFRRVPASLFDPGSPPSLGMIKSVFYWSNGGKQDSQQQQLL